MKIFTRFTQRFARFSYGIRTILQALTLILAALYLSACASTGSGAREAASTGPMEYRIGPSDVLSISVWNHENMDTTVTVRPDGRITYALVGSVYVVGLTPEELQDLLVEELSQYINIQPREVTVVVDAVHSYTVSVLGEVRQPGRFQFHSQITVLDALAQAGGLTEFASRSDIQILRPGPNGVERIGFNYRNAVNPSRAAGQMYVYPGDIIMVP